MFAKYWTAVLFILPIYMRVTVAADNRMSKDFFFIFSVFFSVIIFGFTRKLKKNVTLPTALIAALAFFIQHDQYSVFVFFQWMSITAGLTLFLQGASNFTREDESVIVKAMIATGVFQAFWIILNALNVDLYMVASDLFGLGLNKLSAAHQALGENYQQPIDGSLSNRNLSGVLIALGGVAVLPTKMDTAKKILLLCPVVTALTLCGSVGNQIAFYFPAIFYGLVAGDFYKKIKYAWAWGVAAGVLGLAAISYIFTHHPQVFADHERFLVWKESLGWMAREGKIITGFGPAKFFEHFNQQIFAHHPQRLYDQVFRQMHNEFLEFFFTFGLLGLSSLAFLFKQIIKKENFTSPFFLVFLGFCANSLVNFPGHISSLVLYFLISCSFLIMEKTKWHSQQQKDTNLRLAA